ncbi:MAG TPA: MarR family transcriptional regulator [Rhizomicrobium sp.]|nr:MarR family transcriptional regulator [Rhizomicrobium sp.]
MDRTSAAHVIADRIHSAAIRLLRRLRNADSAAGVSAPKYSALSVLVFVGPQTLKDLAAAEQVRPPTMSRLVAELETEGFVTKQQYKDDLRVLRIAATAKGRTLLEAGRERRLAMLTDQVQALGERDRQTLARAAEILLRLNG